MQNANAIQHQRKRDTVSSLCLQRVILSRRTLALQRYSRAIEQIKTRVCIQTVANYEKSQFEDC